MELRGAFRALLLYDVAEAIDLDRLRQLLGERGGAVNPVFPRRTPDYVRFEHAPLVERRPPVELPGDVRAACTLRYYGFAVVVAELEIAFSSDWKGLAEQAARWLDTGSFEFAARARVEQALAQVSAAVLRPNSNWLSESYLIVDVREIDSAPTAAELLERHGGAVASLLRGETRPLAPRGDEEMLQASLSYYPSDLVVIGAGAALVYDRPEDAAAIHQVIEYAKMQLLEFRYYDQVMTRQLAGVYGALERKNKGRFSRWQLPRDANRLNTIRLDVMDLTERVDSAIKFVSDVYYARVYRLAATRMGVPDYRVLVESKLRTAGELYDFMVDQYHEWRSFLLEVGIGILCLIDVLFWLAK